MKILIILLLILITSIVQADVLLDTLKDLEKQHGIVIKDIHFSKSDGTTQANSLRILRDEKNQLRHTNKENFIQLSEHKAVKEFERQKQFMSGSRVGNGGDVVKCGNNVFVLDHYLASKYSVNEFEIYPYQSNEDALSSIIKKLSLTYPQLAENLKEFNNNFKTRKKFNNNIFWKPEEQLINIQDELLMSKLKSCSLIQAVIRLKTHRTIYFYNIDIMKELKTSTTQLSWMLVHEWLWNYIKNASDLRDINHYLHSSTFLDASEEEIMTYLNGSGFKLEKNHRYSHIKGREDMFIEQIHNYYTAYLNLMPGHGRTRTIGFQRLYKKIKNFSDINTPKTRDALNRLIPRIKDLIEKRIMELNKYQDGEVERTILIKALDPFKYSNNELSNTGKLNLLGSYIDIMSMEQNVYIVKAKVYLEKRSWLSAIFKGGDKILEEIALEEAKLGINEITFQEYINNIFSILSVSVPNQFKNL